MRLKVFLSIIMMLGLSVPASAVTTTVWTEGKRTTTASGTPGQAAVAGNRDVQRFDAGTAPAGGFVFVGRALGAGFDRWIFDTRQMFALNVDWFAPSSRNGGPNIGGTLELRNLGAGNALVSSTSLANQVTANFGPGRYSLTVQSSRPNAFDYDVRLTTVPVPAALGLMLTGLAMMGFVAHRRRV